MPTEGLHVPQQDEHHLRELIGILEGVNDSEAMQDLISKKYIIDLASKTMESIGIDSRGMSARILLSAFLIARHHEAMYGQRVCEQEQQLICSAKVFATEYQRCADRACSKQDLCKAFHDFQASFTVWQRDDRKLLVDAMIERYVDLELAGASWQGAEDEEHQKGFHENIARHQQEIKGKLQRVGGRRAEERLEEALRAARSQKNSIHSLDIPLATTVPIAAIVHELCFSRTFDLIQLISQYGPLPEPASVGMDSDEDTLGFMMHLRENLLPLIPNGTRQELTVHLAEDNVKAQIADGNFSLASAISTAIEVMARSCAPCRDEQIAELKRMLQSGTPHSEMVSKILAVIELMRLDFVAFELIQKRSLILDSVVDYERTYFQAVDYRAARAVARRHPDWTEWLFVAEAEDMESMAFDKQRLSRWRAALTDAIIGAANQLVLKHSSTQSAPFTAADLGLGVPGVLKQRLQQAVKEAVRLGVTRSKEQLEKDGFLSPKHSMALVDLITEIAHFFRLHLAVHSHRYSAA